MLEELNRLSIFQAACQNVIMIFDDFRHFAQIRALRKLSIWVYLLTYPFSGVHFEVWGRGQYDSPVVAANPLLFELPWTFQAAPYPRVDGAPSPRGRLRTGSI